jgi:hypothetical protein
MTKRAALSGQVTGRRAPTRAEGKKGILLLPASTILATEGDWP